MSTPQDGPSPEELKAQQARLAGLKQHNDAELAAIGQMGGELDVSALTLIRLNTFIDFVFARLGSVSPEVRGMLTALFEINYQEQLSEIFKSEVRKAMLGTAGRVTPEQVERLWRGQQNGHGPGSR